jgi:hypothetical protein
VTGPSFVTELSDQDATLANIHSNGFTVYYDSKAASNRWLDAAAHSLSGGGKLVPR